MQNRSLGPGSRTARRIVLVAFVLALGAAAACAPAPEGADELGKGANAGVVESNEPGHAGGTIVYGLIAETDGWNPSTSRWAPSGLEVARAIFDTISAYDSELKIQPNLAAAFEHNDTYTQWKIRIRPGITLHNGKAVTAATLQRNQEYLKASRLTGSAYEPVESFTTEDDLTLVVTMKPDQPWVNYPYALATQIGVVTDPDWLESNDVRSPVGTGPFKFHEWESGRRLVVKKNAAYWRTGYPYLDEVEFRPLTDDDSRAQSLRNGTIDIMQMTSGKQIKQFRIAGEAGEFQVFNATTGETSESFVQINTMKPPLDDIEARRALAYATDKEHFISVVAEGLFEPANGPFAPSSPWYNPEVKTAYPQFDQVKARELVEKVKARNGGTFAFELIGPPVPGSQEAMQVLQQQWDAVGITVSIATVEQAPLILKVLTGDYQATMWQQFDSPHPLGDSIWWHPQTAKPIPEFALNFARNKDEEIGAALDAARQQPDPKLELEKYKFVQRKLDEDLPYVWLFHSQISIIASNRLVNVVNFQLPPNEKGEVRKGLAIQGGSHPLWQVWIKQ